MAGFVLPSNSEAYVDLKLSLVSWVAGYILPPGVSRKLRHAKGRVRDRRLGQ